MTRLDRLDPSLELYPAFRLSRRITTKWFWPLLTSFVPLAHMYTQFKDTLLQRSTGFSLTQLCESGCYVRPELTSRLAWIF